jgi:hypothetical protein
MLLAFPSAGEVLSDAELLDRAQAAFRQGVEARSTPTKARAWFGKAAADYEALRQRGYASAALYRNAGHAFFLAGDVPHAVLAYRRGLRLAPGDRRLRADLAYVREQVAYPYAGTLDRLPRLPRVAPGLLLTLGVSLYGLGWLAVTRWRMVRRSWLVEMAVVSWVAAAVVTAILIIEGLDARDDALHPLVVVARDGVVLRKGNGSSYPSQGDAPLNRGVEARWLFTRGDWLQIALPGGQVGWVPRADVLLDRP